MDWMMWVLAGLLVLPLLVLVRRVYGLREDVEFLELKLVELNLRYRRLEEEHGRLKELARDLLDEADGWGVEVD